MLNIRTPFKLVTNSDLEYAFRECVESKFIRKNEVYREFADKIDFFPAMDDADVNAYAGKRGDRYCVTLLGGLVAWVGHFAFLKTLSDMGMPTAKIVKLAEWTRRKVANDLDNINILTLTIHMVRETKFDFAKYQVDSSAFDERWRSNIMDTVIACISHEIGHICLGHCDSEEGAYDGTIMSANRNIERQADLFSCSIIQCGSGVSTKGVGALLLVSSFVCIDPKYKGDLTHPDSSERVENMITSFKGILSPHDVELVRKMVVAYINTKPPKLPKKSPKRK